MRFPTILILILFLTGCVEKQESANRFFEASDLYDDFSTPSDGQIAHKDLILGHGIKHHLFLRVRNNGNGEVVIGEQIFRFYDQHGDGEHFVNGLASVYFVDLNEDGYKDLVVCAATEISGEKDEFLGYHPFFEIYLYVPERKQFFQTAGSFDPFVIIGHKYYQSEVKTRVILDEKYRYNIKETCDKVKIDIDNDKIPDNLVYSLKKDRNGFFYCTVDMKLSKTKKTYYFSSKPKKGKNKRNYPVYSIF